MQFAVGRKGSLHSGQLVLEKEDVFSSVAMTSEHG